MYGRNFVEYRKLNLIKNRRKEKRLGHALFLLKFLRNKNNSELS